MSIALVKPKLDDVPDLARIFFAAFKGIADRHNFPYDIPDVATAEMLVASLVHWDDYHGVMAVEGQKVLGFNFVQISDAVGGVGPLCVDPARQSQGIGKLLMQHIIEWSLKNHGPMVRLLQENFNLTSLALYASLGFSVQEPIVLMSVVPVASPAVRPLGRADLDACDLLCQQIYKVSRRNELQVMIDHGPAMACIPQGRYIDGQLTAYIIPGFFGYSVGRDAAALLDLAQAAAAVSRPQFHRLLIPTRRTELFASALRRGFKATKGFHLMSIGPYDPPEGAWTPSITY